MKKVRKMFLWLSVSFFAAFALWTAIVRFVDVGAIGPRGSEVGLASLNGFFHRLIGSDMILYDITDWLGLVPIAIAFGFAVFGLLQWIKRKSILKVDKSIIALGVFYIAVFGAYVLFEFLTVNYRPVLINGYLEASYPSSTTLLVLCVIPTALMQLNARIRNKAARLTVLAIGIAFVLFMVIGRVLSGVHWITDIVGGILLSGGLVFAYAAMFNKK